MLDFMDYIQQSFYQASKWDIDNSYSRITTTAQGILDFPTPRGIRLNISSLATPHFSSSYTISLTGPVTGQLSYLYSSLPLVLSSRSSSIPLCALIRGYRDVSPPQAPEHEHFWEIWHRGRRVDARDTLLYGRIFLPASRLEGLILRRTTPTQLLQIRGVSDASLPNGGSLLGIFHIDHGKYSTEYLFSSDSALLGARGLYNFGPDPREGVERVGTKLLKGSGTTTSPSLFSMGFEVYYGLLNKSGGMSTGLRFTTLPTYSSFPYTMTLTVNPLMGNLSSTYAVRAGKHISLCSRFDFNFYSYESGVLVGCELWRLRRKSTLQKIENEIEHMDIPLSTTSAEDAMNPGLERAAEKAAQDFVPHANSLILKLSHGFPSQAQDDDDVAGVLKARVDQNWKIGLLWEGRFKELLYTVGASLDLKRREHVFAGVGVELQYSS